MSNLSVRGIAFSVSMLYLALGLAHATTITLPDSSFDSTPGLYGNVVPFGDGSGDNTFQFQLLYGASLFSGERPIQITGFSVRLENGYSGTGEFSSANYRIDVSSSDLSILTETFNSNHGTDRATVLNGPLTFNYPTELPTGSLVHGFSDPINFAMPFTYDPTSGRGLLIHLFEYDPNKTGDFYTDRHYDPALTTTGSAWSPNVDAATAEHTPATYLPGQAMIIQLHVRAIPEPPAKISLFTASLAFCSSRRRLVPDR